MDMFMANDGNRYMDLIHIYDKQYGDKASLSSSCYPDSD